MGEILIAHRSNSQLSTWLKCGEQYRLQKVERAPAYPAAWLHSGSAFHTAIERWEKSDREMPDLDAGQVFSDEFSRLMAREWMRWPDPDVWLKAGRYTTHEYVESLMVKGVDWVYDYISYARAQPWHIWRLPDESPAIEVPFYLTLGKSRVRGYVDQVIEYDDGTLVVRDLKTGTKPPQNRAMQLGIYAVAMHELFDVTVPYGDYYMAKEGKARYQVELDIFDVDYLTPIFNDLDTAIGDGIFIPNPTEDNCRPCGVQRFCKAGGGYDLTFARSSTDGAIRSK